MFLSVSGEVYDKEMSVNPDIHQLGQNVVDSGNVAEDHRMLYAKLLPNSIM